MSRAVIPAFVLTLALGAFAACGSDETTPAGTAADAAVAADSGDEPTGDASDASTGDAPGGPGVTSLRATINGVVRSLERAQFGTDSEGRGPPTFRFEAHAGGDPSCPDPDGGGAQPSRTLILSGVPRAAVGATFDESKGIAAAYLDFVGDQLTSEPLTKATAVTVKITAIDGADPPAFVDVDMTATFPEGTIEGHLHGEYCASLSL